MSVLPGEPRRAKERGLESSCLLPASPAPPSILPPVGSWSCSRDCWTPLGVSKGPTDPTRLQSPPGKVHHDVKLWLRARGLPSGGLGGTASPATSCVILSLSLNLFEILLCSEGKNRTYLMRSS